VAGPAQVDRAVFGAVPTVWLQQRLVDGSAHWYDAAAALVYVTHFVSIPLVTGVVWFCMRDRFAAWVAAVLVFTTVGVGVYVVYPAAPPWLASSRGELGEVTRISSPGWEYLHLDVVGRLIVSGQEGSNPVAAMPSLHAGSAMLVALVVWPFVKSLWRAALLVYVMLMAVALVYTGEHYVVDVVAGWMTAAVAVAAGGAVHRWCRPSVERPAPRPGRTAAARSREVRRSMAA
jgi:membrane-associated phospholipid phosphatase